MESNRWERRDYALHKKQELGIRVFLATLYISSLVFTGLWMAGYLDSERVTYTRFSQLTNERELKEHIEQVSPNTGEQAYTDTEKVGSTIRDSTESVATAMPKPIKKLDINYDLQALESNLNWSNYTPVKVMATGYTAGIESTGKEPGHPQYGITYSGVQVRRDLYSTIAADIDVLPLGTILYIPQYGYGVVADIGSAIQGNKIDLYYESVENVYNLWGKQELEVFLIKKGNGEVTEAMLDQLNRDRTLQAFKQR